MSKSNLERRAFSAKALAAVVGLGFALGDRAEAQGAPIVEGTNYVRLSQPQQVQVPGKIEVIEFFWYGCPHCYDFDPLLGNWVQQLPPDVAFRRVPVAFRENPFVAHQRIYYALEEMGLLETLHKRVFFAIHAEHQRLDKPEDITAFVVRNGVDGAKFMQHYNSFSVQAKQHQASALAEAYKIDGVPALGVNGQYYTGGALAGGFERMLVVADFLIKRSRKA